MPDLRGVGDVPVCVDGRMLSGGGTGVASYARSLAQAIAQLSSRPCRLVAHHQDDGRWAKWTGALRTGPHLLGTGSDQSWGLLQGRDLFRRAHVHFGIHRRLYRLRCDEAAGIMHWTYPVPLMMDGWINLYTVHDAIPLEHPDLTQINPRRHRAVLRAILAHGDGITTVSQSAKAAIITALNCDPAFVSDTGQSVDVADADADADADAGAGPLPAGLARRGYFLVVGSIEPRKNLSAILAAYRRSGSTLPLVVAGPDGWRAGPIVTDIASTPGGVRLPYVGRAELLRLIAGARALLFPSLAEGFGLPLAEAMALGTPVLGSNHGALAEIAGGASLPVDPADVAAIANAIARLAIDDALADALARRGRERAKIFTFDRFAARLAEVYGDALQKKGNVITGVGQFRGR